MVGACFDPGNNVIDPEDTGHLESTTGVPADGVDDDPTTADDGPDTTGGLPDDTADSTSSDPEGGSTSSDGGDSTSDTGPACKDHDECRAGELCIAGSCGSCTAAPAPDRTCAALDARAPVCDPDTGTCVACIATTCDGAAPVCDPALGCTVCVEHSQCPDSACHLLGPNQGACFDVADAVDVSSVAELEDEITSLGAGASLAIHLAPGSYSFDSTFVIGGEVAIVGQPGTVLGGGATNLFIVGTASSILYTSRLAIDTGPLRAIRCDSPGRIWLDDTRITGYGVGVLSDCETHLRRTRITALDTGVAVSMTGGALFAQNAAFGPGADTALSLSDATLDLRYATIAGNADSLTCTAAATGLVRNSILVGNAVNSVSSACALTFIDNAVDGGPGLGTAVGAYNPAWFVLPGIGDFHLAAPGQAVFADLADWDLGDPLEDVDGDPRPQMAPGFPGIDEVVP